ncbi:NAD(P)-dependent oxidoreductase [Streptomyces wuyuanensis]|nr:NAD(P)-binding domain-containing protein [Streptomyces wuyuanensis]
MSFENTAPAVPAAPVTVLGLGAMGRALAGAFLDAGHPTTVWNRSPGKGGELAGRGAVPAATPEEAVRASGLVVVCVVDDAAARAVLEPLAAALRGRVLVNLTSDTPERSRATAAWAAAHSVPYLDGSVMVPTPVVGSPDALLFHSGSREAFERHESTLRALGGRTVFIGEDPGLAALYDLALLDFFYGGMAALVHAFALVTADGVKAADIVPHLGTIVEILPPIAAHTAAAVDARSYPGGEANLAMMAAGVGHVLRAARTRGLDVGQLEAISAVVERAVARGHGGHDWSSTVEAVRDSP